MKEIVKVTRDEINKAIEFSDSIGIPVEVSVTEEEAFMMVQYAKHTLSKIRKEVEQCGPQDTFELPETIPKSEIGYADVYIGRDRIFSILDRYIKTESVCEECKGTGYVTSLDSVDPSVICDCRLGKEATEGGRSNDYCDF